MRIQERIKQIKSVQNCVWNYDDMSLLVIVNKEGFQNRISIQGQIQELLGTNFLANVERFDFIEVGITDEMKV